MPVTLYPRAVLQEAFRIEAERLGFVRSSIWEAYHPSGRAELSLNWDETERRWRMLFWDCEHGADWHADFTSPARLMPN